jgi:hypothetical protein
MHWTALREEGRFPQWNHEHWPWYVIYLPVLPVLLWHAIRARSLVFFTNVDPAIDMSGFFGERKSEIYALLPNDSYPTTMCIEPGTSWAEVEHQVDAARLQFPLIVKPDIGERGEGVIRVPSIEILQHAIEHANDAVLVQDLIPGECEFGMMFVHDPETDAVELLSITGKQFLTVIGDGVASVEVLLQRTFRGSRQVERLLAYKADLLKVVPALGEHVVVEPIGNHCRGTTFVDASALRTPPLERRIAALVRSTGGVYYGRFDVRADSVEAFQEGRFSIVEMNGVSSEPGHVYDPAMNIFQCWSELLRHTRHIPKISHQLRRQGHPPVSLRMFLERCDAHFDPPPFWRWLLHVIARSRTVQVPTALRRPAGTSFEADPVQSVR